VQITYVLFRKNFFSAGIDSQNCCITFHEKKEGTMKIYVGSLSYKATEEDLKKEFEGFGQVESVNIIKDRYSGESRGFGFVEMPNKDEAQSAIEGLNGREMKGRKISVNEARPRSEGFRGGGRRGGGRR
jgi:RNA recognition motif-containing protein